jgi:hypothetical protein
MLLNIKRLIVIPWFFFPPFKSYAKWNESLVHLSFYPRISFHCNAGSVVSAVDAKLFALYGLRKRGLLPLALRWLCVMHHSLHVYMCARWKIGYTQPPPLKEGQFIVSQILYWTECKTIHCAGFEVLTPVVMKYVTPYSPLNSD